MPGLGAPGTHHGNGSYWLPGKRSIALQTCGDAGFAIDGPHHVAFAVFAQRLPASSAKRNCRGVSVYGAIHIWAPSSLVSNFANGLAFSGTRFLACCGLLSSISRL